MITTKLLIRRTKAGNPICLQARKETAEFYGWTKHFEEFRPGEIYDPATGKVTMVNPTLAKSKTRMGIPLVISRGSSKGGRPATYSNQFRISGEATIRDIAQVAKFTDVDWYWMETPSGERRSREKWLAIHDKFTE